MRGGVETPPRARRRCRRRLAGTACLVSLHQAGARHGRPVKAGNGFRAAGLASAGPVPKGSQLAQGRRRRRGGSGGFPRRRWKRPSAGGAAGGQAQVTATPRPQGLGSGNGRERVGTRSVASWRHMRISPVDSSTGRCSASLGGTGNRRRGKRAPVVALGTLTRSEE